MPGFFNMPFGELDKRDFTVRFGRIESINDVDKRMQIEMCDTPGIYIDIFYQNMIQPMIASGIVSSGTVTENGWGIYSVPVAKIGSIAVIIFHKNEFPVVVGYITSDYKKAVTQGSLDDIKSGEIKIKCHKKSEIYFTNTGNINIKCYNELNISSYPDLSATSPTLTVKIADGNIVVNDGDKGAARMDDTVDPTDTFLVWLTDVGIATGVGAPPSTIGNISSASNKVKMD